MPPEHSPSFSFPKTERLTNKALIEELFKSGQSQYVYPFRLLYLPQASPAQHQSPQVLFTVPKRAFKRATARNRLRRRIREAWRLNRHRLLALPDPNRIPACLAIIYTAKEENDFALMEKKLIQLLERFA